MICPVCQGKKIGKIGTKSYFCWDCYFEFDENNQVFSILEDGSLLQVSGGDLLESV